MFWVHVGGEIQDSRATCARLQQCHMAVLSGVFLRAVCRLLKPLLLFRGSCPSVSVPALEELLRTRLVKWLRIFFVLPRDQSES